MLTPIPCLRPIPAPREATRNVSFFTVSRGPTFLLVPAEGAAADCLRDQVLPSGYAPRNHPDKGLRLFSPPPIDRCVFRFSDFSWLEELTT